MAAKKETETHIYVLTAEHNDYDQHGEYFIAAFKDIPTIEQIVDCTKGDHPSSDIGELLKFCLHIQKGGGRRNDNENVWFNLNKESLK